MSLGACWLCSGFVNLEIDNLNPFASWSVWKLSSLNPYLVASWKASSSEINNLLDKNQVIQENVNINILRMHTHVFLEDPWIHWPDKQDELIWKAPIALGVSELAHLELKLCGPISDLKRMSNNCSRSGVQITMLRYTKLKFQNTIEQNWTNSNALEQNSDQFQRSNCGCFSGF